MAKQADFIAFKAYYSYNNNCFVKLIIFKLSFLGQVVLIDKIKSNLKLIKPGIYTDPQKFDFADSDLISALLGLIWKRKDLINKQID